MSKRFTVLVLSFFALWGCSASGNVNIAKQKSEEIRPSSTVALDVDATPSAGTPEHNEETVRIARNDLSEKLTTVGGFEQVVAFDTPADYTMAVRFDKVTLLPFGARYFGGIYGAVNVLEGDVSLVDNTNGVELTSYSATIKGAPIAWSSESGTEGSIGAFNNKVIEGLQ